MIHGLPDSPTAGQLPMVPRCYYLASFPSSLQRSLPHHAYESTLVLQFKQNDPKIGDYLLVRPRDMVHIARFQKLKFMIRMSVSTRDQLYTPIGLIYYNIGLLNDTHKKDAASTAAGTKPVSLHIEFVWPGCLGAIEPVNWAATMRKDVNDVVNEGKTIVAAAKLNMIITSNVDAEVGPREDQTRS